MTCDPDKGEQKKDESEMGTSQQRDTDNVDLWEWKRKHGHPLTPLPLSCIRLGAHTSPIVSSDSARYTDEFYLPLKASLSTSQLTRMSQQFLEISNTGWK